MIARDIAVWGLGIPSDKQLRGFNDDICGRLLCPSTKDWNDEMYVHCATLPPLSPFPAGLISAYIERDSGFGTSASRSPMTTSLDSSGQTSTLTRKTPRRGSSGAAYSSRFVSLLVSCLPTNCYQTVLAILIAPSAAHPGSQSSGAGRYADRLNLQTLTIGALAFAATVVGSLGRQNLDHSLTHLSQARFALSSDSKCIWAGKPGPGFNNLGFYDRIVSAFELWTEADQKSLIVWWNRCAIHCSSLKLSFRAFIHTSCYSMILSHLRGSAHAVGTLTSAPAAGSSAAIMSQQVAAAAAAQQD